MQSPKGTYFPYYLICFMNLYQMEKNMFMPGIKNPI